MQLLHWFSQRFMNFRSSGTFIRDFLRYGNGFVIILAVLYTLLFYSLAECEPDIVVLLLSGLLGFLTYSFDRMHDLGEKSDIINAPQRTNWLRANYTLHFAGRGIEVRYFMKSLE